MIHPGDPIEVAAEERWRWWRWLTCVHHLEVWAAAPTTPGRSWRRTGWRAASDTGALPLLPLPPPRSQLGTGGAACGTRPLGGSGGGGWPLPARIGGIGSRPPPRRRLGTGGAAFGHSPTGRIWRRWLTTSSKDRGHRFSATTTRICRFGKRRAACSRWRWTGCNGRSDFLITARRACLKC